MYIATKSLSTLNSFFVHNATRILLLHVTYKQSHPLGACAVRNYDDVVVYRVYYNIDRTVLCRCEQKKNTREHVLHNVVLSTTTMNALLSYYISNLCLPAIHIKFIQLAYRSGACILYTCDGELWHLDIPKLQKQVTLIF